MPGVLTDLSVAARLGLREISRRLRGEVEPAPDRGRFRAEMERAHAAVPSALVAEQHRIDLPASEPPWRDSGMALRAGDEVSVFAVGRVYVSRLLDIWVSPKKQIWARIRAPDGLHCELGVRCEGGSLSAYGRVRMLLARRSDQTTSALPASAAATHRYCAGVQPR